MANNPITVPLPQDLPETWATNQIVSPNGVSAGLTPQHGYNYLMQQVNNAQQAAQELGEGIAGLSGDNLPASSDGGETISAALSNKADLTLSNLSDRQKALANIGGRPRKNLAPNWYFAGGGSQQGGGQFPINQRGQTSFSPASDAMDGWYYQQGGNSLSLTVDGLLFPTDTVTQVLRADLKPAQYLGKKATISALFSDGTLITGTTTVPTSGSVDFRTAYHNGLAVNLYSSNLQTQLQFRFVGTPTSNLTAIAAKPEVGEGQTLAYQDSSGAWRLFETPDYLETLQQCQRYLYVAEGATDCAAAFGGNGLEFNLAIPVGVEMAQNLNISYGTLIGYGSNGIVFNSTGGDTFTPSTVVAVGNTVHVSGTMGAQTSAASQGFTAIFTGLVITGSD